MDSVNNSANYSGLFDIDYSGQIGWGEILAGDTILLSLVVLFVVAVVIWVICLIIILVQCKVAKRRRTVEITSDEDTLEKELISISSNEKISKNDVENQAYSKQNVHENTNTIEEDLTVEAMYDTVITTPKKPAVNYENTNPHSSAPPAPPPPPVSTNSTMVYAVVNKKKKEPKIANYDEVTLDTYNVLNRDYLKVNTGEVADGDDSAMTSFYDVIGNGDRQNVDSIVSERAPQIPPVFQSDPTDNYDLVNM